MPSLLRQLQKKKSSDPARAREAVLRPVGDTLDAEITASLNDLFSAREARRRSGNFNIGEDTETPVSNGASLVGLAPSGDELLESDDSIPWWLREPPKPNPQVDALVGIACGILLQRRKTIPWSELTAGLASAVTEASDSLKQELRLSRKICEHAEYELQQLFGGKGPLRPLFDDFLVTEIYVDGFSKVRVVRGGESLEAPFRFRSADEFSLFVDGLLSTLGRQVNEKNPWMNAVIADHWKTRLCVLDPSIHDGNELRLCFRIPRPRQSSMFEILQARALPATVAAWLSEVIAGCEANVLIAGPACGGKTLMLSALLGAVRSEERIVVVENFPELAVATANLEKLLSRPAESSGSGGISSRELIQLAATRDAHRLVVGDIDPDNAVAFLAALEAGWQGSLATMQAENAEDALWRMFDMTAASGMSSSESLMRRVMRSIHLIVTMKKIEESMCVEEISEVQRSANGGFQLMPIVRFAGTQNGKRQWQLLGRNSYWMQKMKERGVSLLPGPHLVTVKDEDSGNRAAYTESIS